MVAQEEDARSRRGEPVEGRSGKPDVGQADIEALFGRTRTELTNLFGSLRRIAFVEWQGIRLRAFDFAFRGAFFVCAFCFVLAASVSASIMLIRGLKLALQAWSGSEWVGDLGASTIILGALTAAVMAARTAVRRSYVRRTEERLGATPRPASEVNKV
ncbi:MAG TPA: hypothetical protein VK843_04910 [Planctomycetota bacterium]|nr:hypothetical protein [Planctomycetota bacterium]